MQQNIFSLAFGAFLVVLRRYWEKGLSWQATTWISDCIS